MKRRHFFIVFFLFFSVFCFLDFRFGPVVEAKTVVISDGFDDGVLNPDLWEIYTNLPKQQPLQTVEQNGRLEFLTDGTQPDLCSGIRLKKEIPRGTKFQVSVDFSGPPRGRNATIILAVHNASTDQEHADQYIWAAKCGDDWVGGGKNLEDEPIFYKSVVTGCTFGNLSIDTSHTPENESTNGPFETFRVTSGIYLLGFYSADDFVSCDKFFISLFAWSDDPAPLKSGEAFFKNFNLIFEEIDPPPVVEPPPVEEPPVVEFPPVVEPPPVEEPPVVEFPPVVEPPPVEEPPVVEFPPVVEPPPVVEDPSVNLIAPVPDNQNQNSSTDLNSSVDDDPLVVDDNDDGGSGGCFIQSLRY